MLGQDKDTVTVAGGGGHHPGLLSGGKDAQLSLTEVGGDTVTVGGYSAAYLSLVLSLSPVVVGVTT